MACASEQNGTRGRESSSKAAVCLCDGSVGERQRKKTGGEMARRAGEGEGEGWRQGARVRVGEVARRGGEGEVEWGESEGPRVAESG